MKRKVEQWVKKKMTLREKKEKKIALREERTKEKKKKSCRRKRLCRTKGRKVIGKGCVYNYHGF